MEQYNQIKSSENQGNRIIKFLVSIFFFFLIAFLIDGSIQQIQMFVFSGNVPIPVTGFRIISGVLCLGMVLILIKKPININKTLVIPWYCFILYIFSEMLVINFMYKFDSFMYLNSIIAYYFFLLILPLVFYIDGYLQEKFINKIIMLFFIIASAIGIAQFLLNDPILPVASNDGNFFVTSWDNFRGNIRAFSIFGSAYIFGHFLALCTALIILLPIKKPIKILLFSMALLSGYATLTRNTYLEIMIVAFSAILMKKNVNNIFTPYMLSMVSFVSGIIVIYIAPLVSTFFKLNIFNLETYGSRIGVWKTVFNDWIQGGLVQIFFGTGLTHDFGYQIVDNMYLAIAAQFGLVGFIIFGVLFFNMTRIVFNEANKRQSPLSIAIASFWVSFFLVSHFNMSIRPYIILFLILIIAERNPVKILNKSRKKRIRFTW